MKEYVGFCPDHGFISDDDDLIVLLSFTARCCYEYRVTDRVTYKRILKGRMCRERLREEKKYAKGDA